MFVANNWALLGGMTFILVSTMYPKISELWGESATVGPPHFNRWMGPIGLVIFALMGLAPLFGWRKTSGTSIKKAFRAPVLAMVATIILHLSLGRWLGYPFVVARDAFYPGIVGTLLQKVGSCLPGVTIALCGFNVSVIVQEFARGVNARRTVAGKRGERESVLLALFRLIEKNRRRYGGYIVHLGIVSMFIGFTGSAWNIDRETAMVPGNHTQVGEYDLHYVGSRMCPGNPKCSAAEQSDIEKRMLFADIEVTRAGKPLGFVHPAKFFYQSQPDGPTTEVSMIRSMHEDLYTVVGTIDPQTKRATFQFHVNPLVSWIWFGLLILIGGCVTSLFPELSFGEAGAWSYVRATAGVATGTAFALWMAMAPGAAYSHERPEAAARRPEHASPRFQRELPTSGLGSAAFVGLALGSVVSFGRRRKDNAKSARN
jgi:cytochrome c-type biogenesis protein CcmF